MTSSTEGVRAQTRILAFPKYGANAASTRQRLLQYEPDLRSHGFVIEAHPLLDDSYVAAVAAGRRASEAAALPGAYLRRMRDLLIRRDYDLIWIHYELFPYLPGLLERVVAWPGKPIIYDFDDAVFHMYDHFRFRPANWLLQDKLAPLMQRVDAVIAGNAYLADYARKFCDNTTIIPTVVDTEVYTLATPSASNPVIGWIGSPSTWQGVVPLLPAITAVARANGANIRVVGAGPAAEGIDQVTAIAWSEASEVAEVQKMDIGIMPVPDIPFMRGKCGYKLIQYMACGLPVVCSPVGVNTEIVEHGVNGFLASNEAEWREALERLSVNPVLRRQMGAEGRKRAVEHYSLTAQQPRLRQVLTAAMARHETRRAKG